MANSYQDSEESAADGPGSGYDVSTRPVRSAKDAAHAQVHALEDLASTIESAIVPRLLISHGSRGLPVAADALPAADGVAIDAPVIESFVRMVTGDDSRAATECVEQLLLEGVPMETVLLGLMAPAARLMGEMWTADLCNFVDVTLGLARMQQMLRRMNGPGAETGEEPQVRGHALLVPAPGEQHTFGLKILEEFLIRDGWDVRSAVKVDHMAILQMVSEEHYDVVGFTLSGERLLPALTSVIRDVRKVSQNRSIRVMVGGVVFVEHPELAGQCGADGTANDARAAVLQVNGWANAAHVN
jgi:MerR family transcriptional regulator, light-induced transcriptional regulator